MYLAELSIRNFRKLKNTTLRFQPGLNVIIGPNNVGKTAVVDALRALLAGHDEPYPRFGPEDAHQSANATSAAPIEFSYVFRGLSEDDEADFLAALKPATDGTLEAQLNVRYSEGTKSGQLRAERWCGDHEDVGLTSDMIENLRGVYLPPLRDASVGLRPSRRSQLSRLFQLLADQAGREAVNSALATLDDTLKKHAPLVSTYETIKHRHESMLGPQFAQVLDLGLSGTDFQRLASRLSLLVDTFEIDQNGLGLNNLIFMAVVLSELAKNPDASYRGLIVEEPEAHLHPQLQAILLSYLEAIKAVEGERPVQLFVTSHSPSFASIADLNSITCLLDAGGRVETFLPRTVEFEKGKREKLQRYLDVTRAELFFARRVIFVEGAAELMLVSVLAEKCGFPLRAHGVSLISVEGLNFDSFLPLFGDSALKIPVAVITDADPEGDDKSAAVAEAEAPELTAATKADAPTKEAGKPAVTPTETPTETGADAGAARVESGPTLATTEATHSGEGGCSEDEGDRDEATPGEADAVYPALGDAVTVSANTRKMKEREDSVVRVFHGLKTLEYDLALHAENRDAMLAALKDLHPKIGKALAATVEAAVGDAAKAKALFTGMFERRQNNVQKGRFGQALAQVFANGAPCVVPGYIREAIIHVCQFKEVEP